jgi:hypothetical protein
MSQIRGLWYIFTITYWLYEKGHIAALKVENQNYPFSLSYFVPILYSINILLLPA